MSLNNLEKLNVLYLTENLYYYSSSDYQVDFIKNLKKFFNLYEFGPGYLNFNKQLCYSAIEDFFKVRFDILFLGHSVLSDSEKFHFNEYSNVIKTKPNIPVVMFLNKEYANLKEKLKFIKEEKINLVFSHHHLSLKLNEIYKNRFRFIPFATTLSKEKIDNEKKYDLNFIGIIKNLNHKHTNTRELIRNKIFYNLFNLNLFKKRFYRDKKILWISHPRNKIESLLLKFTNYKRLSKIQYLNIISQSRLTLNTPSPYNIIGPRYFDALALGSPVICPNHNFYKFYFQRDDLIVFKSIGEFEEKFKFYSENQNHLKLLSDKVKEKYLNHNYYMRSKEIYNHIINI